MHDHGVEFYETEPLVVKAEETSDQYLRAKGLCSEMNALKEVIRNANQMGRLAQNTGPVNNSGPSELDHDLSP